MKNNLINVDTIKKGDTTMYNQKVNNDEPLKRVQGNGRPACTTTQVAAKGGQVRSYTSKVSEVSRVSEVSKMSKQGEQQSLHSLRPMGEGGRRPDEGLKENGRPACTTTQVAAKAAFTLAEVLITLAVIGIVAALTLPGLIQNHNEKAWSTAKDLWEKKLTETVRRMNTDGVMTGHDTTEDFMDTFKQYMKVIKTCDNTDINKCYSPKVVTTGKNDDPMEIETDSLTSASSMGLSDWQTNTNTMSFVVADGTTVIMAYQPECPYADPIEDTGSQVSCMGYMVDVNGKKGPNRVGKDIQLSSGVAFSTCDNPIGDICWSTDFVANRAIDTCAGSEYEDMEEYHSDFFCANNYWAGAKLTCQEKGMSLPNGEQLAQIASELYLQNGSAVTFNKTTSLYNNDGITLKDQYKNDKAPITLGYGYWSSEEGLVPAAYTRNFYMRYSDWYGYNKGGSGARAVCISN